MWTGKDQEGQDLLSTIALKPAKAGNYLGVGKCVSNSLRKGTLRSCLHLSGLLRYFWRGVPQSSEPHKGMRNLAWHIPMNAAYAISGTMRYV